MLSLRPVGQIGPGAVGPGCASIGGIGVAGDGGGRLLIHTGGKHVCVDAFTGCILSQGEFSNSAAPAAHHHGPASSLPPGVEGLASFGSGVLSEAPQPLGASYAGQPAAGGSSSSSHASQSQQLLTPPSFPCMRLTCGVRGVRDHLAVRLLDQGAHGSLGVCNVSTGKARDPLFLRPPPKSAARSGGGGVCCLAGSELPASGCGLVFLGRTGVPAIHIVRVDPPEAVGSTRQVLSPKSTGAVQALACHPSRPLVAVATQTGDVQLWSYSDILRGHYGGGGSGVDGALGAGALPSGADEAAPTSLEKSKRSDDRLVLHPRIAGVLKPVAFLSVVGGALDDPLFRCLAFHPSREWLCGGGPAGGVAAIALWNLDGEGIDGAEIVRHLSMADDDADEEVEEAVDQGLQNMPRVRHFAAREIKVSTFKHRDGGRGKEAHTAGLPSPTCASAVCFHPSEAAIAVVTGGNAGGEWWLSLHSPIDMCVPCSGSFALPCRASEMLCDPSSGRIFIQLLDLVHCFAVSAGLSLDRASHGLVGSSVPIPPSVFTEGAMREHMHLQLPLTAYFLRAMPIIIKAGPGGGADVPAMKSVLYSQSLERDKAIKDRARPRRLVSLPGHTDDVRRKGAASETTSPSFLSGHLRPYRLLAGPFIGDKRRFLILYEVLSSGDFPRIPEISQLEAVRRPSRTVCGLVTQPGYGELETEANIGHLLPASDGCFIPMGRPEPCVLLVEAAGYRLAVYTLPDMESLTEQEVTSPVARVFPAAPHGKVLYVVRQGAPHPTTAPEEVFTEILVYSSSGGLLCPLLAAPARPDQLASIPHLVFNPHERVIDIVFQLLDDEKEEETVWGNRGSTMVAILTSYRVLLASAKTLSVIAEVSTQSAAMNLAPRPLSVAWVGAAAAVCFEDGTVSYLLPSGEVKFLCSLDRKLCAGGLSLVAALPDRLCYLVRGGKGGGATHLMTRPLFPLEPLANGILSANAIGSWHSITVRQRLILKRHGLKDPSAPALSKAAMATLREIVEHYAPPLHPRGTLGEGSGIHAGATTDVFRALVVAGLDAEALITAGVPASDVADRRPLPPAAAFYRRRPWIPASERCLAAASCGQFLTAALEAIGDDPGLAECASDPDVLSSVVLPHPASDLATVLRVLAKFCAAEGRSETARRLLDLAGDDEGLVKLLAKIAIASENEDGQGAAISNLRALGDRLLNPLLSAAVAHCVGKGDPLKLSFISSSPPVILRRSTLLAGMDTLPEEPPVAALPLEEHRGPPATSLRKLALHSLNEWVGRCRPECVDPDDEGRTISMATFAQPDAVASTNTTSGLVTSVPGAPGVEDDRSTWVTVGGQWNQEDNICGYWRFSEGRSGVAAVDGQEPLHFVDLSKYDNTAVAKGGVAVEETTSPTDPGAPGKVAEACDVCFREPPPPTQYDSADRYTRGVFIACPRGSSLDIGVFHDDAKRSAMTMEFFARRECEETVEKGSADTADNSFHILATRFGEDSGQPHVWSLTVEADGRLCFLPGPTSRASVKEKMRGAVQSPPGAITSNRWVHIAFTLDASQDESSAHVTLYIDCEIAGEGTCRFHKVPRDVLRSTTIAIGPNLTGWRVAELRFWAMIRDGSLLHDLREVYLGLAENKRSRLIIRDAMPPPQRKSAGGGLLKLPVPSSPSSARRGVRSLPRSPHTSGGLLLAPPEADESGARPRSIGLPPPPASALGGSSSDARKSFRRTRQNMMSSSGETLASINDSTSGQDSRKLVGRPAMLSAPPAMSVPASASAGSEQPWSASFEGESQVNDQSSIVDAAPAAWADFDAFPTPGAPKDDCSGNLSEDKKDEGKP
jgi:hypothetical protein